MYVASNVMQSKPIDFTDPNTKHDRVLVVGNKKFYVVSGVLSLWSEFFTRLFEGKFNEASKKEIVLKDIDANAFEQVLKIFYDSKFATFGDDLLISLIDLSYYFLAPKVLDSCKSYLNERLTSIDPTVLVRLLDKVCEMDVTDMKAKIINYIKSNAVMNKLNYECVVNCANRYALADLKTWIGCYLAELVTVENCSTWLEYSVAKKLPTLKDGIIKKMPTWDQPQPTYSYNTGNKHLIPEDKIIKLMEAAFKHDVNILKNILRKRIYYLAKQTGRNVCSDNGYSSCSLTINTFLEKNLNAIYALPKEVREYIITSTVRET